MGNYELRITNYEWGIVLGGGVTTDVPINGQ